MQDVARLSDNLRHARRDAGLSQAELAKRSGVGAATVARIEAGAIDNPRLNTLRDLARALGIDPRDLVPDE
jgi:transcriptional regulator with XRE-family HTH domain